MIENYCTTGKDVWEGRVDDPMDEDSFRWHQVVRLIDLLSEEPDRTLESGQGICLLGFCCDEGVRRNKGRIGASKAPAAIRKELANLAWHFGDSVQLFDAGDILCPDQNLENAQNSLALAVKRIISTGLLPVVLGGGHEIAFGHFKGIYGALNNRKMNNRKIGVINFDAHFDLRPYKTNPAGGGSGSPFLQIADYCNENDIEFSYYCLGVQTYGNTTGLFKSAESLGAQYLLAKNIDDKSIGRVSRKLKKYIKQHDDIYLTICSDVFSSAFAPGVSAPQPFGLHPETVLKLVKTIIASGKVAAFDIAEVSPRFDEDNRTAKLAAIIIYALANQWASNR